MVEDKNSVVAFLGPEASYTHQATLSSFPSPNYTLLPLPTISDVFASVQSGSATHGVVPFENSSNGSVVFTLDLFADKESKYQDILVQGEAYVGVVHCLLGREEGWAPRDAGDWDLLGKEIIQQERGGGGGGGGGGVNHHDARAGGLASVIESPTSSGTSTPKANQSNLQHTASLPVHLPSNPPVSSTPSPSPSLTHITKLYSHPQAWGQCTRFLSSTSRLKSTERQDVSSTSRAAQLVAEDRTGRSAAISSKIAAGRFGLTVLKEGIEDRKDNVTRFLVLGKRSKKEEEEATAKEQDAVPEGATASEEAKEMAKNVENSVYHDYYRTPDQEQQRRPAAAASLSPPATSTYKTLLTFTISHANPGALASSLSVFSKHGLNLTSINTRPSGVENWNYIFFVEFQGRREEGGRGKVNEALRELGEACTAWRWLGSWESAQS
ncbi:PDT-domain-containing protein [Pleomassaria siparia CBS 279.74]|uniref:prephenate dehydratase n=1 Tax=Pleomassaria siparia CBS 279.74 TaxID=1314801 RepID=A0A6G1KR64_9PLEO|nr:PDT-domain-containing protein [Pleomassaria siparia CBS 279.74]